MTAAADYPRLAAVAQLWPNETGIEAHRILTEVDRLRDETARLKAYVADQRDAIEYLERQAVER